MDCFGECGTGICLDTCGVCGGPANGTWSSKNFAVCNCNGDKNDCNGVCGGSARLDDCGVCGGEGVNWAAGECDCHGSKIDECKVCGGSGIPAGFLDCEGTKPNLNLLPG